MKWSSDKPTVPGWYWWRSSSNGLIKIVQILHCDIERFDHWGCAGEYQGPIPAPEEG